MRESEKKNERDMTCTKISATEKGQIDQNFNFQVNHFHHESNPAAVKVINTPIYVAKSPNLISTHKKMNETNLLDPIEQQSGGRKCESIRGIINFLQLEERYNGKFKRGRERRVSAPPRSKTS